MNKEVTIDIENPKDNDLINRQEAIDTIRQLYIDLATQKYVIDILKALPSVKPQERTGHWIKMPLIEAGQTFSHKCSLCGRKILVTDVGLSEFPYCHCGARMIELQENEVDNG